MDTKWMDGWKEIRSHNGKKITSWKSDIFLGKKLGGHRMEGSKKLGAWWYGYIVPLTPREGCGLLTSPRVWITFLGLGRVGAQGGRLRKFCTRWFRTWNWWFGRSSWRRLGEGLGFFTPVFWKGSSHYLGGGNSNIFGIFTPDLWVDALQFDEHIFQGGWFNHQLDDDLKDHFSSSRGVILRFQPSRSSSRACKGERSMTMNPFFWCKTCFFWGIQLG